MFNTLFRFGNKPSTLHHSQVPRTKARRPWTPTIEVLEDRTLLSLSFGSAFRVGGSMINDSGNGITVDAAGNTYVTGSFSGTVDFDPGPGTLNLTTAGGQNCFVAKFTAGDTLAWAKRMGGVGHDAPGKVALDGAGNVYVSGGFNSTGDFGPFSLTSAGGMDIFVAKLDGAGNFIWARRMGSVSNHDNGVGIASDGAGNVYTTGNFAGTADFGPFSLTSAATSLGAHNTFVAKLDGAGNFAWAKRLGGSLGAGANGLVLDGVGSVYTTGTFAGTADFDPGPGTVNLTSAGSADIFVSKLDGAGNFTWAKRIGGADGDFSSAITRDVAGNVYLAGSFSGTADFDPGAGVYNLTSAGSSDIFVLKLTGAGDFAWAKRMGGNGGAYGTDIALDGAGNVYTTGSFSGTADFDPGAGVYNLTSADYATDVFVSKLTGAGDFGWAGRMGGPEGENYGWGIALDGDGNVHTTGHFSSSAADFDPGTGSYTLTSAGGRDIFVSKLVPPPACTFNSSTGVISGTSNNAAQLRISGTSTNIYCNSTFIANTPLLNLTFNAGTGANSLTVDDVLYGYGDTYYISDTQVRIPSFAYTVNFNANVTNLILFTGAGNDLVRITNNSGTLDWMRDTLVDCGAGGDNLQVSDHNYAWGDQYVVFSTGVWSGGIRLPTIGLDINFGKIEKVDLFPSPHANTVVNTSGYNPSHFILNIIMGPPPFGPGTAPSGGGSGGGQRPAKPLDRQAKWSEPTDDDAGVLDLQGTQGGTAKRTSRAAISPPLLADEFVNDSFQIDGLPLFSADASEGI